jgi:hypothetical protein
MNGTSIWVDEYGIHRMLFAPICSLYHIITEWGN